MKLVNAAHYFDNDQVLDAYTSAFLFNARMISPAEHVSGDTFRRHSLATRVDATPPARGAIRVMGDVWMLGDNNPDGFKGQIIRRAFSMKRSTGQLKLLTPAEACTSADGLAVYTYKEFYHDMVDPLTESEYDTMWNIYCALAEPMAKGSFFREGSTLFRVRNSYRTVEGFNLAESDQLDDDAVQAAIFSYTGAIDIATDQPVDANIAVQVVQTDVQKFYEFRTEVEANRKPGDRTVFAAQSDITPIVNAQFGMQGAQWRVLAVVAEIDAWALHVRRV